jgi:hypothetical protein
MNTQLSRKEVRNMATQPKPDTKPQPKPEPKPKS